MALEEFTGSIEILPQTDTTREFLVPCRAEFSPTQPLTFGAALTQPLTFGAIITQPPAEV